MKHILILAVCTVGLLGAAEQQNDAVGRVDEAAIVLGEIMSAPDDTIPQDLLDDASCIAVIPGLKQGAFVVGAQYGKGVMLCREPDGSGWTAPSMVRMEGGSFGLQIGGSETDLVMLVMNDKGAKELMNSEFTLGADGTVAAGPVGRSASAETDAYMQAKILAYSRSRGVFAGIALEGSTLRADEEANEKLYGRPVTHKAILQGDVPAPPSAAELISALNHYSSGEGS